MAKRIVGVDFGHDSIRAVELSDASSATPTIVKVGEVVVPERALVGGEVREINTVAGSLKQLWSRAGITTKDVVIGTIEKRTFIRELTIPETPLERVREVLPTQAQDLLPIPVSDAVLDFYPIERREEEGAAVIRGLVIAAATSPTLANVDALRRAGLRVTRVDATPFAVVRASDRHAPTDVPVAHIHMGAESTTVAVTAGGVPHFVRTVDAGGDAITRALTTTLEMDWATADAWKRRRGFSGAPGADATEQQVAEVLNQVIGEQLQGVVATLQYVKSSQIGRAVAQVRLSGGASALPGIVQPLSQSTGLPVVSADPFEGMKMPRQKDEIHHPNLFTAFGLAYRSVA